MFPLPEGPVVPEPLVSSPPQAARIDDMLRAPTDMPMYFIMLRREVRREVMPRIKDAAKSGV
jgi:hypothetical protein